MHENFWELERYDWENLRKMGNRDIPQCLRRLLFAENDFDVNYGYDGLDNCVVVQGSVFEAALPVVRCIATVLHRAKPLGRGPAMEILFIIINGGNAPEGSPTGEDIVAQCVEEVYQVAGTLFGILETSAVPLEREYSFDVLTVLCYIKKDHSLTRRLLWYAKRWLDEGVSEETRHHIQKEIDFLQDEFFGGDNPLK